MTSPLSNPQRCAAMLTCGSEKIERRLYENDERDGDETPARHRQMTMPQEQAGPDPDDSHDRAGSAHEQIGLRPAETPEATTPALEPTPAAR